MQDQGDRMKKTTLVITGETKRGIPPETVRMDVTRWRRDLVVSRKNEIVAALGFTKHTAKIVETWDDGTEPVETDITDE